MKEQENIRIAIAGGGTGGHLFPALNLGRAMEKAWGAELLFFGTTRGLERYVVTEKDYPIIFLPVRGLQRKISMKNLIFPIRLWRSLAISKRALKRFKPHLVLGTGGYVMGPVLKSALSLGLPIVIQEQNSYPGLTTRMLAKKARCVFLAYEEARKFLPSKTRAVLTGNPIRPPEKTIGKEEARRLLNLEANRPTVMVVGGSQGAENINRAVMTILKEGNLNKQWQWLWQTGKGNFKKWSDRLANEHFEHVKLVPFIGETALAYLAADLVICRAGAMTLSELMAYGKPAILIPNPYSPGAHQFKNALVLAKAGAAYVLTDNEKLANHLQQALKALMDAPERIEEMAQKMHALYPGDGVGKILELIAEILKEKGVTVPQ